MEQLERIEKDFVGKTIVIKHDGHFDGEVTIVKINPNLRETIYMNIDSDDLFQFVVERMKKHCYDSIEKSNFRQLLRMMDLT